MLTKSPEALADAKAETDQPPPLRQDALRSAILTITAWTDLLDKNNIYDGKILVRLYGSPLCARDIRAMAAAFSPNKQKAPGIAAEGQVERGRG